MRRLIDLVMLLGLCLGVQAQLARYSVAKSISHKHFVDSIDIEWENRQVYLPVEIGGKTYRFLFDTGSAQAVIFADRPIPGCVAAGQILSHDAVGASDTVKMLTLPPIKIGRNTFVGCQATLQQRAVNGRNIDGIIGFDVVNRGLNAKIDVRQCRLILTDQKNFFDDESGYEVRYKLRYHVPYLIIKPYGRFSESALFDTGSRHLYAMNRGQFHQMADRVGPAVESQVEGRALGRSAIGLFGTEPLGEVVFLNFSRFRFGDCTFTDLHTTTTQGDSHIGASILEYGALVINPQRKRMRFLPYEQTAEIRVGNPQTEIAFVSDGGRPCVGLVWERGEPFRQGFRQGDIITAIDGRPVGSFAQFVSWGFERGRQYRFTVVNRQGQQREIRWVRLP